MDTVRHVTELVYKKLKKRAPHLLQYFVMRFDERGRNYFNVEVPPAFEGYIINQINEVM